MKPIDRLICVFGELCAVLLMTAAAGLVILCAAGAVLLATILIAHLHQ